MKKGDLVRYYKENHVGSRNPMVTYQVTEHSSFELCVVLEYNTWEKIATVLLKSGKSARVPVTWLRLHKRSKDS